MAQGNGGIIGKLNAPTVDAAAGVWTKRDMELAQQANKWPQTAYQYQIARSLRFNSADSAYLNRTPASATNRKTWTLSTWAKVSAFGSQVFILGAGVDGDNRTDIRFDGDSLQFVNNVANVTTANLKTTAVYRDPSAWYHIVIAVDSTQATSTNRIKIYVNGVEVTSFSTSTYFSQNTDTFVNNNCGQTIGRYSITASNYFNGYITEFYFVDGTQLTPSSFGETNAQTGVWQPKAYSGTYGTNGFYLNFSDNSNTTAATLGKDYSGNGNNWTPNNFSVTAGAGNDSLVDSPTSYGTDTGVGGTVRGNYCTLNPLTTTAGTYTQGNLRYTGVSQDRRSNGTISVATGKWYWEVTLGNAPYPSRSGSSQWNAFGFGLSTVFNSTTGQNAVTDALILEDSGYYKNFSGPQTDTGTAFSSGDVLSIAVDLDANTFTFRRNNTSLVTGTIGGTAGRELVPIIISYNGDYGVMDCNFGQRPFAYTAPSGFKALCTQNLPTPAVGATAGNRGGNHFNAIAYTGDGVVPRALTGFGFSPDLLWSTRRDVSYGIQIFDSVRGAGKRLNTGYSGLSTAAEDSGYGLVNSFDADGYTTTAVDQASNNTGGSYLTWGWNAGESTVSNTNGSITSSVRANPTAGISVVGYTGNGTSLSTVGHGLGAVPSMVIVKARSASGLSWYVYQKDVGNTKFLELNSSAAPTTFNLWESTNPTSSVFTISNNAAINGSGTTFVAYCFAEVQGFSKFGSYVGNGSADGTFVYCGFRPRWIMVKSSVNASWPWWIVDTVRGTVNPLSYYITTNTNNPETNNFSGYVICDALSNGFKMRSSDAYGNTSGDTYIFAAFAEFPFKYGLAR